MKDSARELLLTTQIKQRGWSGGMIRKLLKPVKTGTSAAGRSYQLFDLTEIERIESTREYSLLRDIADAHRNRLPRIERVQAAVKRFWTAGVYCVPLQPLSKGIVREDVRPIMDTIWQTGPTLEQVSDWFSIPANVGIMCGVNGWCVRDFDDDPSYWNWRKAFPHETKHFPTYRTKRGYHVLFKFSDPQSLAAC